MYKKKLFIMFTIIILLLGACRKNKDEVDFKKKDKAPDSIVSISDKIQDILKDTEKNEMILDGTYIKKEDKEEDKEEKDIKDKEKQTDEKEDTGEDTKNQESKEEEGESAQSSDNKSSQEDSQEKEDKTEEVQERKDKEEKNKEIKATWEKIEKEIEEIHKKWNDYESQGIKKGMTGEIADDFRNNLNDLTRSIEGKNIEDIYNSAAECFLHLSPIFNLYKDEIKGEVTSIKYAVYKSYVMGMNSDIDKGINILADSEKNINLIRSKTKEDDKEKIKALEKLNLSIADMKKSLSKESIKLKRIKKDVIISNLEALNN